MDARAPTRSQVVGWLEAVQHDLDRLHDRLAPLLEEQRRLEARQGLLKDLLSSFEAPGKPSSEDASRSWVVSLQPKGGVGEYVRGRAEGILREAGRPMHINEIHQEFEKRGFPIPGAGRSVNLIVHLRKQSTIVSPARGTYALAELAGPMPTQRKTTRKRRKRARSTVRREV
jgi:hypothetical protein